MNTQAATWAALSGAYALSPGRVPSITGGRPVLGAGRLAALVRGQQGERVGRTLTSVFTLCAHAHRRTADLALACAQGSSADSPAADRSVLLLETVRDHLRMIALEWPQRAAGGAPAPDLAWLRECPLSLAGGRPPQAPAAVGAFRRWLEQRVLLEDAAHWLSRHEDPSELAHWCAASANRLPPAACLASWFPKAHALAPETRCLEVLDDEPLRQAGELRLLAQALAADPDFVQRPLWRAQCAETGPWARLRHRHDGSRDRATNAWTRLASRWVELVELAAADKQSPPLLASGALALGSRQAIAWCEMARGLLVHWVRLDARGGVEDYRVLAPTEWNFHPAGSLAAELARIAPDDAEAARVLSAAYDPCVACTIMAPT